VAISVCAGIFYVILICNIAVSACSSQLFIYLETIALKYPDREHMPRVLRALDFEVVLFRRMLCCDKWRAEHHITMSMPHMVATVRRRFSRTDGAVPQPPLRV
jgi:hypothetical protein